MTNYTKSLKTSAGFKLRCCLTAQVTIECCPCSRVLGVHGRSIFHLVDFAAVNNHDGAGAILVGIKPIRRGAVPKLLYLQNHPTGNFIIEVVYTYKLSFACFGTWV